MAAQFPTATKTYTAQTAGAALPFDVVQSYQDEINAIEATLRSGVAQAQVFHNTTQSLTSLTWTALLFNSEDFDIGALHSTVSNTSRLTVPAGLAGTYLVGAAIPFAASALGVRGIRLRKNGATQLSPDIWQQGFSASGVGNTLVATILVSLAVADYMEVDAFQDTGGALNVAANARLFMARQW